MLWVGASNVSQFYSCMCHRMGKARHPPTYQLWHNSTDSVLSAKYVLAKEEGYPTTQGARLYLLWSKSNERKIKLFVSLIVSPTQDFCFSRQCSFTTASASKSLWISSSKWNIGALSQFHSCSTLLLYLEMAFVAPSKAAQLKCILGHPQILPQQSNPNSHQNNQTIQSENTPRIDLTGKTWDRSLVYHSAFCKASLKICQYCLAVVLFLRRSKDLCVWSP
jgi:hypothetical protein